MSLLKLYFFFFFFSGSAFVLNEAFLLSSRIFRVKGLLCAFLLDLHFSEKKKGTGAMECEVRRGEEREGRREGEMKGERKRETDRRWGWRVERPGTEASYQSREEPIAGLYWTSP